MQELQDYFKRCLEAAFRQEAGGASWTIEREAGEAFVLFEKSNGMEDWMNNLHIHAVPYRGMRPVWQCHAGFLRVWQSVQEPLARAMQDEWMGETPKRITVIG